MPEGQVLEFSAVTKRFGAVTAVDRFTARVEPGKVTGFLGPNGAGKTTTLRILLGLVGASEGSATIGGVPYAKLANPLQSVGAVLEASSFHPGRTAVNHLKVYAQAANLPDSRVDEALGLVGLADVAGRKVGGYSLGMRQRLGLAYALLGDPGVLVLDEPANGLDPEGIRWMRGLLRDLARQGRTVLVSSHMLAEVQQTVDSLLIIAMGRLVFQGGLEHLTDPSEYSTVVDAPDRAALVAALSADGIEYEVLRSGLTVRRHDTAAVGRAAAAAGVALSTLQRRGPALEEVFLDLVNGARVHPSATAGAAAAGVVAVAAVTAMEDAGAVAQTSDAGEVEDGSGAAEGGEVEDEGATGAAGAAAAAAAGGPEPDLVEHPIAAGAALATGAALASSDDSPADDSPLEAEADTDSPAPTAAVFAVAGTGVIDVIPSEEPAPDGAVDGAAVLVGIETDVAAEHTEDEPSGVGEGPPDGTPADANEDAVPADGERPWEDQFRTESDEDADRFFSSFDSGESATPDEAPSEPAEDEPQEPSDDSPDSPAEPGGESASEDPDGVEPPPEQPPTDTQPPVHQDAEDQNAEDQNAESGPDTEEPPADTTEFGTLADLSPDWVDDDARDAEHGEGGESR